MERKPFNGCLVERGEEKNYDGAHMFSLRAHQNIFFPKWRENLEKKTRCIKKTGIPICKCTWIFVSLSVCFYFSFFLFLFPFDFYHNIYIYIFFEDKTIEFLLHKTKNYIKKIGGWRHVSSAIDIHTHTTKPLVGLNWDCKRKESKMKTVQIWGMTQVLVWVSNRLWYFVSNAKAPSAMTFGCSCTFSK